MKTFKQFKEYLNEQESKYIDKHGFLKTKKSGVGRGPHDKSSAYQKALKLRKQKENKKP